LDGDESAKKKRGRGGEKDKKRILPPRPPPKKMKDPFAPGGMFPYIHQNKVKRPDSFSFAAPTVIVLDDLMQHSFSESYPPVRFMMFDWFHKSFWWKPLSAFLLMGILLRTSVMNHQSAVFILQRLSILPALIPVPTFQAVPKRGRPITRQHLCKPFFDFF